MSKNRSNLILTIFIYQLLSLTAGQVCSPIGMLCEKTTDCCRSCCEGHMCVKRDFPCSTDLLIQNPGGSTCSGFYCPSGYICYMFEICSLERPCPLQPGCRKLYGPGHDYKNDLHPSNANQCQENVLKVSIFVIFILLR